VNQCSYRLSLQQPAKITRFIHIKNDNGLFIVFTQSKCGKIHHIEAFLVHFIKAYGFITHSIWYFLRICGIDSIYARAF